MLNIINKLFQFQYGLLPIGNVIRCVFTALITLAKALMIKSGEYRSRTDDLLRARQAL